MRAAEWRGGRVSGKGLNDARTPLADFFSILLDLGLPFLDSRARPRVG